jgi:hypothetical protein
MLQVYVPHVSSVLDVCCKCMFQLQTMFHVFHLDVAMTIQVYVLIVYCICCNGRINVVEEMRR